MRPRRIGGRDVPGTRRLEDVAEDALERIVVDYEPLPAIVHLEDALAPGATVIHDELGTNLNAHVIQEKGDYAAAVERAEVERWLARGQA